KNQKRCCQRMGEPPEWRMILSLTIKPPGMKKLVPPSRSISSKMPPAKSTGKESKARIAVVNHVQTVRGIRIKDIPLARMLRTVVMKFKAPKSDPRQNMAILMIQRVCPNPWPGPATWPRALSGAYAVQPEMGAPPA